MRTTILLPPNLNDEAKINGFAPAGYYIQSQHGRNNDPYINLMWDGDGNNEDDGNSDFSYWHDNIILNNNIYLWET